MFRPISKSILTLAVVCRKFRLHNQRKENNCSIKNASFACKSTGLGTKGNLLTKETAITKARFYVYLGLSICSCLVIKLIAMKMGTNEYFCVCMNVLYVQHHQLQMQDVAWYHISYLSFKNVNRAYSYKLHTLITRSSYVGTLDVMKLLSKIC
jgi:hypothetical protein